MCTQIAEVQAKNDAKRLEIEVLQTKEKALMAEFLAGISEQNKFADYLTKVYRKRIKRSKKKKKDEEGSEHIE